MTAAEERALRPGRLLDPIFIPSGGLALRAKSVRLAPVAVSGSRALFDEGTGIDPADTTLDGLVPA